MYDDPTHPHFMDFKDWGTSGGPAGSVSGGTTTYHSYAAGTSVTGSVFEAFGNFWYGFAGTWAGISDNVLYGAAALMQEGATGWIPHDGLEDTPHVTAGMTAAKSYKDEPSSLFTIHEQSCSTGASTQNVHTSELPYSINLTATLGVELYQQVMLAWTHDRYNEYVAYM